MSISKILKQYKIKHYRYDVADKTLLIYEAMKVKDFVKMKLELKLNKCKVDNIIIIGR